MYPQEINDQSVKFTFAVNGEAQPTALSIPRSEFPEDNFVLFPHVLSRNFAFQLNFGNLEEPLSSHPAGFESYNFVQSLEDKVPGPTCPAERSECEVSTDDTI